MRGWARRATILLIMKKGYKQVMKKISNEVKRMHGLLAVTILCYPLV